MEKKMDRWIERGGRENTREMEGERDEKERRRIKVDGLSRSGRQQDEARRYTGSCLYRLVYSSKLLFYRVSPVIRLSRPRIWDCPRPFAGPSRVSTPRLTVYTLNDAHASSTGPDRSGGSSLPSFFHRFFETLKRQLQQHARHRGSLRSSVLINEES